MPPQNRQLTRRLQLAVAVLVTVLNAATAAASEGAAGAVDPYGAHDAGGFLNVLTPGEAGSDNAAQLALFELNGTRPAHFADQAPLYEGLLGAAPSLTDSNLGNYFKDATFGVRPGKVESSISPEPGLTVLRDSQYGVPHVYGKTRAEVMYGAGYAAAQDRLFMMDVLRHTARAQLSSFVGGDPANRQMDRDVWAQAPYTQKDLHRQIAAAPRLYGAAGRAVIRDGRNYVAGVNAFIDKARTDATLLPSEYAAIGKLPAPWHLTDSVAEASLIGIEQGQGGGGELNSALTEQAFERRFGKRAGRRSWLDFRERNDPESPTTVSRRFPYRNGDPFAPRGLAMPDVGSVSMTPPGPPLKSTAKATATPTGGSSGLGASIGRALLHSIHNSGADSNALLVRSGESNTGHPIAVMGPQVDYYSPEILMEEDLHGPGIDARGAAFPGVNQYVQLGHGRDYAWSATSAEADNVDTFAEVLCRDAFHYRYHGRCLPMERLDRRNAWTPNAADQTPAGSETLTVYRTVHGIVYARGRVDGRRVAFARSRSTYMHESDSALGFRELNNPKFLNGPGPFRRAISKIDFTFNWFYAGRRHIAYQQSGWYPRRAPGTSPDFPLLGTGRFDWRRYRPARHLASLLPAAAHPHATDPRYLVSWNNKPAPGFSAADDNYAYGPIFRSQLLSEKVAAMTHGSRRASASGLVRAMAQAATQDLRAHALLPIVLRALGQPGGRRLASARKALAGWVRAGAYRRDLDANGHDEHNRAIELWDAWYPRLVRAEFQPTLKGAYARLQRMIEIGTHVGGDSFFGGWWGYVSKDLRALFGSRAPHGAFSRTYCGGGSRTRCRAALRSSLRAALGVTPQQLYGQGDCTADPEPACADRDTSQAVGAIDEPSFPFQNRPTFQQVVRPRGG